MTELRPGRRVKVTIEGAISECGLDCGDIHVETASGSVRLAEKYVSSVEVLPDPEPDWQYGDVVTRHCNGLNATYIHDGFNLRSPGGVVVHPCPDCQLTLLARDGEPVTQ